MTISVAPDPVRTSSAAESSSQHYARKLGGICPECGGPVQVPDKGPGQHKKFCDAYGKGVCKTRFANREKAQGAVVITLLKVWHINRHGKTPEARQIRGTAMAEIGRVLRHFVRDDKKAGRAERLAAYVQTLVNVDDSYQERRRRR